MTAATNHEPISFPADLASAPGDACLIEANVNLKTGLATDYLNHFNEAIMLLELLAEMPECRADFFAWQPKNYGEHFAASNSKHRDIAIAAYAEADPALRQRLDALADGLNKILMAAREVMRRDLSDGTASAIADLAVRCARPLVVRAGAVINGTEAEQRAAGPEATPQAAVDVVLAR